MQSSFIYVNTCIYKANPNSNTYKTKEAKAKLRKMAEPLKHNGPNFEDFQLIFHKMKSKKARTVDIAGDRFKADVRWMHHTEGKWVFSLRSMDSQTTARPKLQKLKLLFLPKSRHFDKILGEIPKNTGKWSHKTFESSNEQEVLSPYSCLEGLVSDACMPYILCLPHGEDIRSIGIGLYTQSKTKRKRYRLQVHCLLLLDRDANSIYRMKDIHFEGNWNGIE